MEPELDALIICEGSGSLVSCGSEVLEHPDSASARAVKITV